MAVNQAPIHDVSMGLGPDTVRQLGSNRHPETEILGKSQGKSHGLLWQPEESHGVTFAIFHWLQKSQVLQREEASDQVLK